MNFYKKRSGAQDYAGIMAWMESCFEGRSRAIRMFTQHVQWTEKSLMLKDFVENADCFEIDIEALQKDGLLEGIYFSPSFLSLPEEQIKQITNNFQDEALIKLNSLEEIDFSPVDWSVFDDALGRRMAFVPYYLFVIKGGVIPASYLTQEKQN